MKVIASVHNNRPKYSKACIDAMKQSIGIENYHVLFYVEPVNDEVIDIIRSCDLDKTVVVNSHVNGININQKQCGLHAFLLSNYVILIEDDVLISKDALQFFEFANERYKNDLGVFSVTGYNREYTLPSPKDYYTVFRRKWYHPWGVAAWRRSWNYLLNRNWKGSDLDITGYDCYEIYPVLSRCQNIGIKNGFHNMSEEFYRTNHYLANWAGQIDLPGGTFREDLRTSN